MTKTPKRQRAIEDILQKRKVTSGRKFLYYLVSKMKGTVIKNGSWVPRRPASFEIVVKYWSGSNVSGY
jgi:hypothetical protein